MPYNNEATAIGIVPLPDRKSIRKILSCLSLLGSESKESVVKSQNRAPCATGETISHEA